MQYVQKQQGVWILQIRKGNNTVRSEVWAGLFRSSRVDQNKYKWSKSLPCATREPAFIRTDLKPSGLEGMKSPGKLRKGSQDPVDSTTSWRMRESLEECQHYLRRWEHRFHSISACLPQLGKKTKMRSIPFTPSNSHQMLMPLDSPTATVPKIISFQRSGIWSSLDPTRQHFNCIKLFIRCAIECWIWSMQHCVLFLLGGQLAHLGAEIVFGGNGEDL